MNTKEELNKERENAKEKDYRAQLYTIMIKDYLNVTPLTDALFLGTEEEVFKALEHPDNVKNAGDKLGERFMCFYDSPRKHEIFRKMIQSFTPQQRANTFINMPKGSSTDYMQDLINTGIDVEIKEFNIFLGYEATAAQVALYYHDIKRLDILRKTGVDITNVTMPRKKGYDKQGFPKIEQLDAMTYAFYTSKNDDLISYLKQAYKEKGATDNFFLRAQERANILKEVDIRDKKIEKIVNHFGRAYIAMFPIVGLSIVATAMFNNGSIKPREQDNQPQSVLKAEAAKKDVSVSNQASKPIIKHSTAEKIDKSLRDVKLQRN